MKKKLFIFILLCSFVALQSCGTKAKENANDLSATTEEEVAAQTQKTELLMARRAKLAKARAEKEEQRKSAMAERALKTPSYKNSSGKLVYYQAEYNPFYTGGDEEMAKYLKANLKYPQAAVDNGVEGTVYVDFIVDENGIVRDVTASDYIGDYIDQELKDESVRVVSAMPAWVAGRQNGKNVSTAFSLPITFQIEE